MVELLWQVQASQTALLSFRDFFDEQRFWDRLRLVAAGLEHSPPSVEFWPTTNRRPFRGAARPRR
jgi:hypothetical protein